MKVTATRRALLLVSVLALPLSACGSDAGSGESTGSPAAGSGVAASPAAAAKSAYPRTVKTSHGAVRIASEPKRIVVLGGAQMAEAVLALGGKPIVIGDGGAPLPPWLKGRTGDAEVETIAKQQSVQIEKIAAAKPDLIVSSNYITAFPGVAPKLKALAPTIDVDTTSINPDWNQILTTVADALGKPAQGTRLVAKLKAQMAAAGKGVPAGTTYDWVRLDNSGWGFGNGVLLDSFGLKPDKHQNNDNQSSLSLERSNELTGDAVFVWPYGKTKADVLATPGVSNLPSSKNGTLQVVGLNFALALNSPGAYSIPWIIKEIKPTLTKLASAK
ncbi:ABC transporter substrate-binding protein [Flexivirga oryzae]|uniref:Iron complex transport system substrate-binding protein n=1 Tax=Flexivirga oryzae TaxID=1794944 RepID=A0A839N5R1_9MICO|nr:ABC transporter substrate-binding protein [Flexivirga oryzae]MBB2890091.1 iron complex transport system substrate-binding protein [Flexivirga oryzae]